ncbi:recombination repair protein 1 isoform X2 [Anopheles aquasalis]|uniref:recombination repair protein 1 isoform X2 n=1 Tax=Anopheles aquasalis TaxID=42839 RepID=UPI00215A8BBF|nr:recombination repair protein 1 isoform X2 [Anopheles aquasalis]
MEQQPKKRGRQARASKENEPLATVEQTTENMEPSVPKPKGKAARKKPSDEVKPSIESIKDAVTDAVKQEEPGTELNAANGEKKPATKTGGRAKKEKVTKAEVAKEPKVKRVAEKKPKGKGKATEEGAQEEAEQPPAVLQEVPLAEIEKKVRGKAAKTVKATAEAEEPTVAKTGRAKNDKNAKPAEDTKNESPKKVEKKPAPAKRGKNTKEKNPEPAADTAEEKKVVEDANIAEVTTKKGRGKAKAIPEVEASDQLVTKRKPKGKDVSPMATAEPAEPVAPTKTVAKLTGRGKKKAEPEANDDAPSVAKLPRVAGKGKRGAASKMVDAVPVDAEPAGAEVGAEDKKSETKESPSVRGKGNVLTNFIRKITQRKRRKVESEEEAEEPAAEPKATAKKGKKAAATAAPKMNKCSTDYSALSFEPEQSSVLWNYKISSWNVAGLRSWVGKGGLDFIEHEQPDILCLQETKCTEDQLPDEARHIKGYHPYWLCKPGGYAGVAIYSRKMPIHVSYGLGDEEQDQDGRLLTAEYEKFYLVCVYVPNAGNKLVTLPKRMRWDEKFHQYLRDLDSKKPVILCGDMNVAHEEIDLANPKTNKKNAGFTQEERDGMSKLLSFGFVDTFRQLYPDRKAAYSFWTYMGGARAKNVGWRLDYFIVSQRFADKVTDNVMRSKVYGSDHCPVTLFLNL